MTNEPSGAANVFTIGNGLTFARLVLLPIIIVGVVTGHGWIAAVAMMAVVLTDLLDGRIARRLKEASAFGKTLDSTVDFVLIYSLFITFYAAGRLATYQFAFLYLAMLAILSLQFFMTAQGAGAVVTTTTPGKVTGALQYGYLLILVALEVVPQGRTAAMLSLGVFVLLAAAIVVSSIESVAIIARAARRAKPR
jgi:phosphatidylglycerophosphate synthase